MPLDVRKCKNEVFKYLKHRVWKRVQGWIELIISVGGKELLIKSLTQSIPTFSMSCFKLPKGLCDHINSLIRNFWWGSKRGKRKTCWVSWEKMTMPKHSGALGFRDMDLFNLVLLARQASTILESPNTLCAHILKVVYYPNGDFLDATVGSTPS
jgi:hypothetical protein